MLKNQILVTGASGFIGNSIYQSLINSNYDVVGTYNNSKNHDSNLVHLDLCRLKKNFLMNKTINTVIHCAAKLSNGSNNSNENKMGDINFSATVELAKYCFDFEVQNFIFISSAKVYGENSPVDKPFDESASTNPIDDYALSKLNAENELIKLSHYYKRKLLILRLPIVYGAGVKGNILSLINHVERGLPFPFKNIDNKKSYLALNNLVNFIEYYLINNTKLDEINPIYNISDNHDVSTTYFIKKICKIYKKNIWFLPIPNFVIYILLYLINKKQLYKKLFGNLQININKILNDTGWRPKYSIEDQLNFIFKNDIS